MPLGLLRFGLQREYRGDRYLPSEKPLDNTYDVVIIGGGGHGLAIAYYLAKRWGITNVAVLEKSWLGAGNTAGNAGIICANFLAPVGAKFCAESMRQYRSLAGELRINLMYRERGHLTLVHSEEAVRTARWRAEINRHVGIESKLIGKDEIARLCPQLNLADDVRQPVLGALYHSSGAIARHDAVVWGYARAAAASGVDIHQQTEVTAIQPTAGNTFKIETTRGTVSAGKVVQAVAGLSSEVARLAGLRIPCHTIPLQACVSEPLKPYINPIIASDASQLCVSQAARGELVMTGSMGPHGLYSSRSSLEFMEGLMANLLDLLPELQNAKVLRQWAGIIDTTPDSSPLMGETPLANYYIDAGWGDRGFQVTPAVGNALAELVATERTSPLIRPFELSRFDRLQPLDERSAASLGY